MARKTISQRIQLLGSEEVRKELAALGAHGEAAFRDIQAAAEKLRGPGAEFARNMDRARKRIRELGQAFDSIGTKIRNFGAGLSVAVTAPVTLLGRSFIQAASDAEEARSAFGFLFGESADEVRKWATTLAAEIGRGSQAIQDQAAAFQQLFGQVAPTHDAAVRLSKDFTVLAQDLASFYNLAEDDALAKLRSGLAGEAEPLRAFGVFINAAAVEAKALELGLTGVNDELTDQEKVLARAAIILEETTAAQGDAARTSDSYANQLKRLQGVWNDLSVTLGEIILPAALQVVQVLSGLVSAVQELSPSTQEALVVLAGLAATLGPLLAAIGLVVQGIGGLAAGFAAIMGAAAALTPILAALSAAWGVVTAAMQGVLALVAGFLSWPVLIAAALAALAVAVVVYWDEIVAAVAQALGAIEDATRAALGSIRDWFGAAFDWIRDKARGVLDWIAAKLRSIKDAVSSVFSGGSGGTPGFAGGGRVRGPGTATSDSILARLSTGEFVVRARAVQHYGAGLFERLNSMVMPRTLVPGFAGGGLVVPIPAESAGAGGGGPVATLNLSIGGEVFEGLTAPREVADRLIRFALGEEIKSAGRRPGWFAGGTR